MRGSKPPRGPIQSLGGCVLLIGAVLVGVLVIAYVDGTTSEGEKFYFVGSLLLVAAIILVMRLVFPRPPNRGQ
jgi:hypothetical protein